MSEQRKDGGATSAATQNLSSNDARCEKTSKSCDNNESCTKDGASESAALVVRYSSTITIPIFEIKRLHSIC